MDIHRMFKARSFKVCLAFAFFFGFCRMPLAKLFSMLLRFLPASASLEGLLPKSVTLTSILENPFPVVNSMLIMFSVCYFYYADIEHGFIKNIAGQVSKKGYTMISRFIAVILHNLIFIAAGIIGNLIGNVLFIKVTMGENLPQVLGALGLRFLLLQGVCAILLLVTCALKSKTFGMVLAVIFGTGAMTLIYMSIDTAFHMAFKKTIEIENYMPDQLMDATAPPVVPGLPVAIITIVLFLILSVRIFDRREVR
jgi:hypothetical protein